MAGSAVVTTTIRLVGEDRASAEIDKARKATKELADETARGAKETEKAGSAFDHAFEHGLPGLNGKHVALRRLTNAAGEASAGFGEVGHAVALVDAAFRVASGPVALLAIGVTALAAGGAMLYSRFKEAEKATNELREAFVDLGVPIRDVEPLVEAARQKAVQFGKDGDKAAELFRKGIQGDEKALVDLYKMLGRPLPADSFMRALGYKQSAEKDLDETKKKVNELATAYDAAAEAQASIYGKLRATQAALSKGTNFERAQARATDINQDPELVAARARTAALLAEKHKAEGQLQNLTGDLIDKQRHDAAKAEAEQRSHEQSALREEQQKFLEEQRLLHEHHKKQQEAWKKHQAEIAKERAAFGKKMNQLGAEALKELEEQQQKQEAAQKELAKVIDDAQKREAAANAKAAQDPHEKARIRLLEVERQKLLELQRIRDVKEADARQQAAATLAVEKAAAAERASIAADEKKEDDDATKKKIKDGMAVAGAVSGFMKEMGVSKQIMAAIDGAIQTADAIASAAEYDYVGAVQHGLAAAAYFAAAAGSGGGGASAPSGGAAFAPAAPSAPSGGKGGNVINVNFSRGFVTGTPHEVGKGLHDTLSTLAGTGFASARGA